jgi:DNA topoisomerase-6 subunit B
MACREILENSFPYDEPILIREEGRIRLVSIGELVERKLPLGQGIQIEDRYYSHLDGGLEILTLDEDLKLCFKTITAVFKHKSPDKIWEVRLGAERAIRTTASHNLFLLNDALQIVCKPTRDLKPDERVIVPSSRLPHNGLTEIRLLDELNDLIEETTERIVLHGVARHYPNSQPLTQKLLGLVSNEGRVSWKQLVEASKSIGPLRDPNDLIQSLGSAGFLQTIAKGNYEINTSKRKKNRYTINKDWVYYDFVPFNFFRKNRPKELDENQVTISVKQGKGSLPARFEVTPELMRILGYFSSEGSIFNGYKISFSFGTHELETLVKDAVACLRTVFGVEPTLTPHHESAINVVVNDATIAFLFEKVFGTGRKSSDKRVPWIVFNVSEGLALNYLEAYTRGDGYVSRRKSDKKITLSTSSRQLFTDLKYLLTILGRHFSAHLVPAQVRTVKGIRTHFDQSYELYVREGINPSSDSFPTRLFREQLVHLTKKTNPYNPTIQKKWIKNNIDLAKLPKEIAKFVVSDAGSLGIKSITEVPSDSEWVYDVSVEGVERFIGGQAIALLHNSLDATELQGTLPEIYIRIVPEGVSSDGDPRPYRLSVSDNGPGVEARQVPSAFGKVFYGSKYVLRQSRGMFGLGGTMAILYGQITTNKPVRIITSTDGKTEHIFEMLIDISENRPIVVKRTEDDAGGKTGTRVDLTLEGDYLRASQKITDYIQQTALIASYANLTFVDPLGRMTFYERATTSMPPAPKETLPHPHGIDVEAFKRLIKSSEERTLQRFMVTHFHRVGDRIANRFLIFAGVKPEMSPDRLNNQQIVTIVDALQRFPEFLQPDAGVLSPVGEEILTAGIIKELAPEFSAVVTRPPSSYSGFPFLVEVGLAYGAKNLGPGMKLFRFANRIPLLYDESSDVSFKVINEEIDWRRYKVPQDAPVAVITSIVSTRIPYKTVGKEYIADRPEVEKELRNALREALRRLSIYLSRKGSMEAVQRRMNIFGKYLPLIARFSTDLAGKRKVPDYKRLIGQKEEEVVEENIEDLERESERATEPPVAVKTREQKKIDEYGGS